MMTMRTEARIAEIRTTMHDQRNALLGMIATDPDCTNFDAREKLWMDREDLRHELDVLLNPKPSRFAFGVLGPMMRPAYGAACALLFLVPA